MTQMLYEDEDDEFNLLESIQGDLYEYENRIQKLEDDFASMMAIVRGIMERLLEDGDIIIREPRPARSGSQLLRMNSGD